MMRRIFTMMLIAFIITINLPVYADTLTIDDIQAEAGILIDDSTNEILFEKNAEKKMFPASTTKILTAIIILENHEMDEIITMDGASILADGSSLYSKAGEQFTIEQSLYALMVRSANDVAEALAIYHSGSIEAFAVEMNAKAVELGARNSNFKNPNGLPDPEHVTTAYDMAMIAKYCMQNEDFRKLAGTMRYQIPPTPYQSETRYLINKNKFLDGTGSRNQMLYRGKNIDIKYDIVEGVKTGFTGDAGNCLISSAKVGNQRYISVILNSPELYVDSRTLLDYGFENFTRHQFVSKGSFIQSHKLNDPKKSTVNLIAGKSLIKILSKNIDITKIQQEVLINQGIKTPIKAGDTLGKISYLYNNIEIANVHLVSEYDVSGSDLVTSIENTFIKRNEKNGIDITYYINIVLKLLISFVIYRIIVTVANIKKRKRVLSHQKK